MSEHFLGSKMGFEILANSVQNPAVMMMMTSMTTMAMAMAMAKATGMTVAVAVGGGGGGRQWQWKSRVAAIVVDQFTRGSATCVDNLAIFSTNQAIFWHLCICTGPKKRWIIGILFVLQKNTKMENGHFVCVSACWCNKKNLFTKQTHKCIILILRYDFCNKPSHCLMRICVSAYQGKNITALGVVHPLPTSLKLGS
jgi:hypothetical protein